MRRLLILLKALENGSVSFFSLSRINNHGKYFYLRYTYFAGFNSWLTLFFFRLKMLHFHFAIVTFYFASSFQRILHDWRRSYYSLCHVRLSTPFGSYSIHFSKNLAVDAITVVRTNIVCGTNEYHIQLVTMRLKKKTFQTKVWSDFQAAKHCPSIHWIIIQMHNNFYRILSII